MWHTFEEDHRRYNLKIQKNAADKFKIKNKRQEPLKSRPEWVISPSRRRLCPIFAE